MNLIFIEGIPSSGKSTLAEQLWMVAQEYNIPASWHLEESDNHPVHPREFKHNTHSIEFAERCIHQWKVFFSEK